MEITYELIGEIFQATGVLIILITQAFFVRKARKKYGSIGTAFLEIQAARLISDEYVKKTAKDKQKLKEALKLFPHAKLLYDDFKYSLIGLIITLAGLIISMFDGSMVLTF